MMITYIGKKTLKNPLKNYEANNFYIYHTAMFSGPLC